MSGVASFIDYSGSVVLEHPLCICYTCNVAGPLQSALCDTMVVLLKPTSKLFVEMNAQKKRRHTDTLHFKDDQRLRY